jgi:hypothetical protein
MDHASDYGQFSVALGSLGVTMMTEVGTATVRAYWEALSDLPAHAMAAAIKRAQREAEAFPKPIELRRHARAFLADEQARRDGAMATRPCLPFRRYAFMLAELADPEVPERKKERIKTDWKIRNPGVPGPWEQGDVNQW